MGCTVAKLNEMPRVKVTQTASIARVQLWSGEVLFHSLSLSHTQLTNGKDRSIYKHSEVFPPILPAIATPIHLLSRISPFPFRGLSCWQKGGQASQRTPTASSLRTRHPSLRTSNSFMIMLLPPPHRSQAHLRSLCPNERWSYGLSAICRAQYAEHAERHQRLLAFVAIA